MSDELVLPGFDPTHDDDETVVMSGAPGRSRSRGWKKGRVNADLQTRSSETNKDKIAWRLHRPRTGRLRSPMA